VQHSPAFLALVAEARVRVKECSVHEVRARQEAGEHLCLVDVREDHEWARGYIPGAIHIGRGILERDVEQRLPDPDQEIILYCGGGYRSVLAADNLQKMGYTHVLSMAGGIRGWREAGYPVRAGDA
jgi:rhodanese-related sulfurtransferase